jgi:hypothetical protein
MLKLELMQKISIFRRKNAKKISGLGGLFKLFSVGAAEKMTFLEIYYFFAL